jgi:hypothetical protein
VATSPLASGQETRSMAEFFIGWKEATGGLSCVRRL